jgi:hypothetical protein
MRKLLLPFIVLLCTSCSLDKAFVKSCQKSWNTIKPEYIKYVQNDAELDEFSKNIRIRTAEGFSRMLQEAENAGR